MRSLTIWLIIISLLKFFIFFKCLFINLDICGIEAIFLVENILEKSKKVKSEVKTKKETEKVDVPKKATAKKTVAKKTVAKKTVAKKTVAKKTESKK